MDQYQVFTKSLTCINICVRPVNSDQNHKCIHVANTTWGLSTCLMSDWIFWRYTLPSRGKDPIRLVHLYPLMLSSRALCSSSICAVHPDQSEFEPEWVVHLRSGRQREYLSTFGCPSRVSLPSSSGADGDKRRPKAPYSWAQDTRQSLGQSQDETVDLHERTHARKWAWHYTLTHLGDALIWSSWLYWIDINLDEYVRCQGMAPVSLCCVFIHPVRCCISFDLRPHDTESART